MRSFRRTVLVLTLVLLASGVVHAAPRVRDVWHSYVNDGKRCGYFTLQPEHRLGRACGTTVGVSTPIPPLVEAAAPIVRNAKA